MINMKIIVPAVALALALASTAAHADKKRKPAADAKVAYVDDEPMSSKPAAAPATTQAQTRGTGVDDVGQRREIVVVAPSAAPVETGGTVSSEHDVVKPAARATESPISADLTAEL